MSSAVNLIMAIDVTQRCGCSSTVDSGNRTVD